ncbi:adaptor protein MecA [Candidatus Galacturonibacter soehngenii]|uniref:Adaptor protein MecA n=1 Tax=Candidatus Galacturonatibacter soehngenii TaxID=2307010 RepID=A0A7V7QI48_9FIRM|nr:adaptor protein MecA [Candidatus Galacturonibacter soehngenii]KAB1435825.1 adaptor protein MecA [Candidatus Galacturonibacter soehngenii]MBA4686567.1 adaptor protein MecA [Candidatus Galacturonibacter soehngenii]
MKIEKVNDNQIRCTLTKDDLADRELKISELAYGTEKAKSLFRDMMQQASYEFGFEAEDIPLMIEAIPLSPDCIILVITKVEDPEELDTRFSRFAPSLSDKEDIESTTEVSPLTGADDVLDLFKKIHDEKSKSTASNNDNFVPLSESLTQDKEEKASSKKNLSKESIKLSESVDLTKLYSFDNLDTVIRLSSVLEGYYDGKNSLYKETSTGKYYLVISKTTHTPEQFNKICNILSEYASQIKYTPSIEARLREHDEIFITGNAVQILSHM